MGILGAFTAALAWGTDAVLARQGLRKVPPALGTFLSLCASMVVCLIALAISGPARYPAQGVLWFMMIGLCNFLVGRQCNFRATQRLGAARASSLMATAPLVSVTLAVVFTGERLTLPLLAGVLLTVGGVVLIVRR
jgi:drug/metabolite transporter (DMT)-like permease